MNQRIRIKDIAEKTGVSIGTIDRVLHNRGHVAADVRERVEQAMQEMGYEPNIVARSLANNKKLLRIAAILPDFRQDVYWAQPKEGIERAAEAVRHYGVAVDFYYYPLFEPKEYLKAVETALASKPGAVLFAPVFLAETNFLLAETTRLDIPKVMINTHIEGTDALSYIGQDSYQSGVLAGRLLNFGLQDGDQAMVVNLDKEVHNARHLQAKQTGFKDFFEKLDKKSIEIHSEIFEDFDDRAKMKAWALLQFEKYPRLNGFFVTNSRAYKLIQALDPAMQSRVKVVGFDLIEPNLDFLEANKIQFLINQNAWHQGYLGIMSLVNHLILKKEIPALQHLPLDIIVRENVNYYLKRSLEIPMILV